jgi:ADP-heptose:LPS heptosyltransferase
MRDNPIGKFYRKAAPLSIREAIRRVCIFRPWRFIFLPLFPLVLLLSSLRRKNALGLEIKNILVMNFGAIGDNLRSTAALRALNAQFPKAAITIMTANIRALDVYIHNPRVSDRLRLRRFGSVDLKQVFRKKSDNSSGLYRAFICYPLLAFKLLAASYDLGVNFCAFEGGAEFGNLLMYLCGIPRRLGAFGSYTGLLTDRVDSRTLEDKHWVNIYLGIVEAIGARAQGEALEFYVTAEEEQFAEDFLRTKGVSAGDFIIGVHPGGNTYVNNKRWPYERFAEVINRLGTKYVFKVLLFGSRDETPLVDNLRSLLRMDSISVVGLSLAQVGGLLKRTAILLTNDNGIMHLADAVGSPRIVSIFGPTDPRQAAPKNKKHTYIEPEIDCAPCLGLDTGDESKRCFRDIKEECLQLITAERVCTVLEKVLDRNAEGDSQ